MREGVSGREALIVNHRGRGRETERETETANVGKIGCERERQRERETETKHRETKRDREREEETRSERDSKGRAWRGVGAGELGGKEARQGGTEKEANGEALTERESRVKGKETGIGRE